MAIKEITLVSETQVEIMVNYDTETNELINIYTYADSKLDLLDKLDDRKPFKTWKPGKLNHLFIHVPKSKASRKSILKYMMECYCVIAGLDEEEDAEEIVLAFNDILMSHDISNLYVY
jgi:hypothetical protein